MSTRGTLEKSPTVQLHTHVSIGQVLHSRRVTAHEITLRNRSTVHAVTRPARCNVRQWKAQWAEEKQSWERRASLPPGSQAQKRKTPCKASCHAPDAQRSIAELDQIRWWKMYSQVVGRRPSPLPRWKEDLGHARGASSMMRGTRLSSVTSHFKTGFLLSVTL